ncbi:MAG: sulfatase-like hydrolase/transferase [Bacteroidales bacterium]
MKPAILLSPLLLTSLTPQNIHSDNPTRKIRQPNVLILFADDQRADALSCSGNSYIRTPNIDQLATNGVRFSNSYAMGGPHGAISAPSRAMLLSGKSLFHVYDKLAGIETMPAFFAKQGYRTFATGKWHNEASAFEASFQEAKNMFLGGMCDHDSVPCQRMENGKLTKPENKGYSTDLFADAALRFLENYSVSEQKKPFFCYVAFTAPHDPRSPRKDYIGTYPDGTIPLPGNFKVLHPFEFDDLSVRDEHLAPWPRTPEIIQQSLSDYYALITHLDNRIGDIISMLKSKGLYENTIIVYAADNGLAIGSHGLLGKQSLYEHSMKVPLIIKGPGVPKGQVRQAMVYLFDLYPTLSRLCGIRAPNKVDGQNLVPVINGKQNAVRTSLYTAYRNTIRAVRTEDWKMIWYPQRNYTQLFNLKDDPLEISNLVNAPEYQQKLKELRGLMEKWHEAIGDTSNLHPKTILPLEYDYLKLKQKPDAYQPEYVLKKYFKGIVINNENRVLH